MQINILVFANELALRLAPVGGHPIEVQQEAWWILQHIFDKSMSELLKLDVIDFPETKQKMLNLIVNQRLAENKPLAYILGSVPFCGLNIMVRSPTLIPRPETEEWVDWTIRILKKYNQNNLSILDLCCGSGCIGLALARELNDSRIVGIDISSKAIQLSNENKIHLQLNNVKFIKSNLFENLPENFKCDLIVSNPPYLSTPEYEGLPTEVKAWEDKRALEATDFGMYFYKEILSKAKTFLNKTDTKIPQIVFEIGPAQDTIANCLHGLGYGNFEIHKDMQGKNRWVAVYVE